MTSLDSLAPETLARILELAAERSPNWPAVRPVLETLAAASLVARRWRDPAQGQMWRTLDLGWWGYASDHIPRITASAACGRYRTTRVRILGMHLGGYGTVHGLLGKLRGLESIDVFGYCGDRFFETEWLNLPSLAGAFSPVRGPGRRKVTFSFRDLVDAGVTQLSINTRFPDVSRAELNPAFRLHTLQLGEANNSPTVVAALLAASPNLASLELKGLRPTLHPTLLAAFPLFANHLTTLTLSGNIPPLAPALSSFSSLTRLVVSISSLDDLHKLDALLAAVTPPVKSLSVAIVPPGLGGGFGLGLPLLKPLWERLVKKPWEGCDDIQAGMYHQYVPTTLGGTAFVERCEERGIAVIFL